MTTFKEIIANFDKVVTAQDPSLMQKVQVMAAKASMEIHSLHAKAIACHCECMGMNAENGMAVCANHTVPYGDAQYFQVMQKWGLIDENNEPII